jgi:cytochrome c553
MAAMSALALASTTVQASGDAAKGEALATGCIDCHGENGKGSADGPAIAGMSEEALLQALEKFKTGDGVDEDAIMPMIMEDLSAEEMADLAAYYSSLGK